MPTHRIDTLGLKSQIFRKLGKQKAGRYFFNLKRLLNSKLSKMEFDKFCRGIMGKETIRLHNLLIRSIISNACLLHCPLSGRTTTGHSRSTVTSDDHFGEAFLVSPRKSRSITSQDRRLHDRPSPLGLHAKMPSGYVIEVDNSCDVQRSREQHRTVEMISIGSKALLGVASVEDGEEVEQVRGSPIVQCKTPVSPPLGIPIIAGCSKRRAYGSGYSEVLHLPKSEIPQCCQISSVLPDALSLRQQLKHKLETEGLNLSEDYIGLLNHGLDAYLKRLIKPCMALARTRRGKSLCCVNDEFQPGMHDFGYENSMRRSIQCYSASLVDFKVAMQSSPQLLGVHWPVQLEKICLFPSME